MNKVIIPIFILIGILFASYFQFNGYDSVCFLKSNCNRGFNPTIFYGFPILVKTEAIYTDIRYTNLHIVKAISNYIIWMVGMSALGFAIIKALELRKK